VERIRNDITMGALRGLAVRLGSIGEGRKVDHLRERRLHGDACRRRCGATTPRNPTTRWLSQLTPRAGQDSNFEQTAQWFGQSRRVFAHARSDHAGQPQTTPPSTRLDPRGLAPFENGLDASRAAATYLVRLRPPRAAEDAGHAALALRGDRMAGPIVNRNTLAQGLAQIARTRASTTCSATTPTRPPTASFHKIEVKVKAP
jgi:hypothetical protein